MSTSERAVLSTTFKLTEGQEIGIGRITQHTVGESFERDENGDRLVLVQIAVELLAE